MLEFPRQNLFRTEMHISNTNGLGCQQEKKRQRKNQKNGIPTAYGLGNQI